MPKATRHDVSKVIVSAREGHAARAQALEQIADLNEEISKAEDPDFDPESTHPDSPPPTEKAQEEGEPEEAAPEEPDEEPAAEQEPQTEPPAEEPEEPAPAKEAKPERKYKLKVNGKELEVSFDELVARAQKVESADQYLAEAVRVKQEAYQPPVQRADAGSAAHPSDEEDAALVRAIQVGTEDEAKDAIRKLRDSVSVKTDQTVATIDERFLFLQAVDRFRNDYSDILKDPVLQSMAFALDQQLLQAGDKRPYEARFKEVGDLVRGKVREWAAAYGTDGEGRLKEKAQRKAQAPAPPKAAGAKATPQAEEEDEEGPEDYSKWIRQEAERRGKHYGVI
jgi:chemotaxis protein histidine kinase CheA